MYIESEFALLEAQNEQLTRENKKLVAVLKKAEEAIKSLDMDALGIGRSSDGRYRCPLRMELLSHIEQALAPYQEECTCLPDLPDGRSRGVCYACGADTTDEIPFGGE